MANEHNNPRAQEEVKGKLFCSDARCGFISLKAQCETPERQKRSLLLIRLL
jgi:hypothetical protein